MGRCGRAGATGVATTFVVDGDEALVPPLAALLERSRQNVPPEMHELARKVVADAARAASRGAEAAGVSDEDEDEEKERLRMRIANREKQLAKQREKKIKGGGKGGRR